ncbi:GTP-binding protein rho3 precursor, partial [Decorospora gaudefroyi]
LASAWSQNKEPTPVEAQQPIANDFIRTTVVSGRQIELSICDLSGNESYSRLRPLSYRDVHVVLICFDISEPNSFENISELWNIEAEHFLGDVPKILVGCKKDLRNDKAILEELRKQNLMPISPYAGDKLAIKMQALAYFETSAVKQEGLAELFDYVAEASLKTPSSPKLTRLRRFLSRSEIKFR